MNTELYSVSIVFYTGYNTDDILINLYRITFYTYVGIVNEWMDYSNAVTLCSGLLLCINPNKKHYVIRQ